jgi:hypothetical protein
MSTIPPDNAQIDEWLASSGTARQIVSESFIPGKGFHVRSFIVGYTLPNSGAHQFARLAGDPTTDETTAKQLHALVGEFGAVSIRAYEYAEAIPSIPPQEMAAESGIQSRVSDMTKWCQPAKA